MNEEELLKKFAKALGAEQKLEEIEQKKIQQEKMLKGMAKLLGNESLLEEIENKKANEQALIEEKREKERKMLEQMNAALARLVGNNPEHAEVIQQEVEETIAFAVQEEEPVAVVETASQPQPELPKDDIVTKSVTAISKAGPGEIQQVVDALPAGIRKELNIIKRSITDLHRFATNHSQLGGGGEVKLARLDDVDATSIADGLYLRYDLANNMFVFDAPAGGNGGGSNGISVTNATVNGNGSLIITYSNLVTANAGYVIGSNGAVGANGANGAVGANGADGSNGISVTNATVNGNGSLIITYSNSTSANAGYVVGPAGANGTGGDANNAAYLGGYAANQYAYANALSAYQTTAGLSANVVTLAANSATYLGGNTASDLRTYASDLAGNAYLNAVAYAASNTTVYNTFAQNTSVYSTFAQNTSVYSTFAQNTAIYVYAASNSYVNSTFQTTAGLSANVATLTANAAGYLNGKTESNLNVNNALTSNNAAYLGGIIATQYAYSNQIGSTSSPVRQVFTGDGACTTFTVTGGYVANQVDVYVAGVKVVNNTDANVQSGSTIVFTTAPLTGTTIDVIGVQSYTTSSLVTNTYFQTTIGNYVQNTDSRTLSGNLTFSGLQTYTYTGSANSTLVIAGTNTKGGTGYHDFLMATNGGGGTNPSKWFRINSTGGLEIINSAYSATLMALSDAGNLTIPGTMSASNLNGPAFSAYANNTLQTITSGSQQKVLFQTEEYDTNNNYANSRFTPTVAGYYQLNAEVRLDGASGTGEMMIVIYKNGSEYKRGTNQSGTQIASSFWAMTVSSLVYANGSGDYFEIYVQQGSGGSVTVTAVGAAAITWFNGCMVRGA